MVHKYTLCCNKGELFRSGKHFFVLDRWITPPQNTTVLILSHGIISENEYQQIRNQERIAIYQSVTFSWIGIYPYHETKKYGDYQFSGYLKKENSVMWGGYIHVG